MKLSQAIRETILKTNEIYFDTADENDGQLFIRFPELNNRYTNSRTDLERPLWEIIIIANDCGASVSEIANYVEILGY